MAVRVDTSYCSSTANKSPRDPGTPYVARLWHETANGSGNPYNTLEYNLSANVGSSYDFLIARDGTIFQYIDYHNWTAWHAGDSYCVIDGVAYADWDVNEHFIGIELDGPNNGEPCTQAQIDAAALLAIALAVTENIPLTGAYDVTHAQVAPGRKSDPQGATVDQILARARMFAGIPATDAPYDAWWTVIASDGANVREAPTRNSPIALDGTAVIPCGETFSSDTVNIGQPISGDPIWIHHAAGLGFIHRSCLEETV
jgi:N-acetylmuramoyl-L-alanine amidase